MSARTADSQFQFELPSLSYIDAKWEEPNLRTPAGVDVPVRNTGLAAWFARRVEGYRIRRRNRQAAAELATMSDHELKDIGISRSDLSRAFEPSFNRDLRQRGA